MPVLHNELWNPHVVFLEDGHPLAEPISVALKPKCLNYIGPLLYFSEIVGCVIHVVKTFKSGLYDIKYVCSCLQCILLHTVSLYNTHYAYHSIEAAFPLS